MKVEEKCPKPRNVGSHEEPGKIKKGIFFFLNPIERKASLPTPGL